MHYTLVREKKRNEYGWWKYSILGMPGFIAATNFNDLIGKVTWYAKLNNEWQFIQYNRHRHFTQYIPILSIYGQAVHYRKYKIHYNGEIIGEVERYADETVPLGTKSEKLKIYDKEYWVKVGNTWFARPRKQYRWSIEDSDGKDIVIIEKNTNESIYEIELKGSLNMEVIIMLVMMKDQQTFMTPVRGL